MPQFKKAFTLVELLAVMFIIAIIISLSVIVFDVSWGKSRDSKRVSDIIRLQNVLENYHLQEGKYPDSIAFGEELIGSSSIVYLTEVPENPSPRNDGACASQEYQYSTSTDGYGNENFYIQFCLGSKMDQVAKGMNCATSQGITPGVCTTGIFACGQDITDVRDSQIYPTVQIGGQCWLAKNVNYGTRISSCITGDCVGIYCEDYECANSDPRDQASADSNIFEKYCYGDSDTSCTNDGGLYQWHTALGLPQACDSHDTTSPCVIPENIQGVCPPDWHVPTAAEWNTLGATLGGNSVAGRKLKASSPIWDGTNSSGFTGLSAGSRGDDGGFSNRTYGAYTWATDPLAADLYNSWDWYFGTGMNGLNGYSNPRGNGFSVRCIFNEAPVFNSCGDYVFDSRDSQIYSTVQIGNQCWFKENLRATKYTDGTNIPNITNNTPWENDTAGAYSWYNNNYATYSSNGPLYNYYAANHAKICPTGWHVPSDAEWTTLTRTIIGDPGCDPDTGCMPSGTYAKSSSWDGDNSSGLTILPSGFRYGYGAFYGAGTDNYIWAIGLTPGGAWTRYFYQGGLEINRADADLTVGASIRCLKN